MKRKLTLLVLACLMLCCTAFVACNTGVHTHKLEKVDAKTATCEQDGNKEYYYCAGCKKYFSDEQYTETTKEAMIVSALGHDEISHDGKDATCTEKGYKAYVTCSRCNYSTYEEIAALDHDYKEEVTKPATCVAKGEKTYTCKREGCNHSYTEEIEIDENAHDLEQVAAQDPSYESVGWEAYEYCKREDCKHSTYKEIAKWAYVSKMEISAENPLFVGNMLVGDEASLLATVLPEDAHNKEYVWSSSDASIVSVDEDGKIKALAVGSATVKATAQDGSDVVGEYVITVSAKKSVFDGTNAVLVGCSYNTTEGCIGGIGNGSVIKFRINSATAQTVNLQLEVTVNTNDHAYYSEHFASIKVGETVVEPVSNRISSKKLGNDEVNWNNHGVIAINGVELIAGENEVVITASEGPSTNVYSLTLYGGEEFTEVLPDAPITEGTPAYFEGEDAVISGNGITTKTDDSGARNNTSLQGINDNKGATLTYKVTTDKDVKAGLYVCLALGGKTVKNIFTLKVNDATVDIPSSFTATGTANWATFEEYYLANIELKASQENVIVLTVTGGCGNYDYMKLIAKDATITKVEKVVITPITEGTPAYFEGEDAVISGNGITVKNNDAGARSQTSLQGINDNKGATLTYKVKSNKAVKAGLYLNLAFGSSTVSNIFTLTVNGVAVEIPNSFTATGTANWNTYEEYWLANVDLVQDENVIVLKVTGGCGNYDYMKLIGDATITAVASEIDVETIKLTTTKELLKTNDTVTLASSVAPSNATDKTLTWTSSDESVATVDTDGKVTAIKEGYVDITATAKSGKSATIRIFVSDSEGTRYEAESATLVTCKPETGNSNYVGNWNASASATFTVDGGEGGKVLLRICTSVVHDDKTDDINKYYTVKLNDADVDLSKGTFAYNGEAKGWTTNTGFFTIELTLKDGNNTIALYGVAGISTCLDCIVII